MGQNTTSVKYRYTMAPTTKAGTAKPLLGQPDSVLSPEFLLAVQENRPCDDILPFDRPLQAQLPSIEQVLKLYYFLREMVGKTNKHVSNFDVSKGHHEQPRGVGHA